ncbi:ParA family protein [Halalkalicoccus jeotgali]|uniref:ATPase involved in chromosome partitioning-like protein n=1 Tax=Halalkalicoccus jeotgali (strain DSM 18796 / CECT 7217 / JCM 14584 / KCTC 4019 / B3) TaxID=795797 RepID=D8JCP8_HALJB|nr:ParA family protein [Halalkalicoccus jeotgali]ADJ16793.1 ATPase involved in chromosome partitioning-like protein [Halalkalicoccus jeotgali B3]ADJ17228.1 ATPase involved in chromosome partitioning-like protein [Halalkalicoccus jeotgali B3]ELY41680.1 chromosome partitioning protein ParA [Halalkalicoccus jeotgali B3]
MVNAIQRATTYVPKGGVGKTTSTAHIAVSAHNDHGLDTLLIDLAGTQNDLATQFGLADDVRDPDAPISAVFSENWSFIRENIDNVFERMVFETDEGPDLIPADNGLGAEDNNLANVPRENRYDRLERFITDEVAPRYDLVLLDLPGKEDNITINGLFAAENVIAPLKPGEFERKQLENLQRELAAIRDDGDHDAQPMLQLVFATMVDSTTNLADEFTNVLAEEYPKISGPPISESANIGNEQANGRTLFALSDDELYDTGRRAREAYRQLTTSLLERLEAR